MNARSDLLHSLAYLHLRHGQNRRALITIQLAVKLAPEDPDIQRTLAYALLVNDAAADALEVLDRQAKMPESPESEAMLQLLRSRALLRAGRVEEARLCFHRYLEARS
jgi:type III secretion protein Y